jgi:hypothetical protein
VRTQISCGSIDYNLCLFKGLAEIRIADWSWLHKISRAIEQVFKILCEPEELLCMLLWCRYTNMILSQIILRTILFLLAFPA